MSRLEHLVLASTIPDSQRFDHIRERIKTSSPDLLGSRASEPNRDPASDNTRKSATEARISVLMMTRCKSRSIRDRALLLLCESLDTNLLSTADHELMHLQMLWVELVQLFRHVVDAQTRKLSSSMTTTPATTTKEIRVMVDSHLENLLRV